MSLEALQDKADLDESSWEFHWFSKVFRRLLFSALLSSLGAVLGSLGAQESPKRSWENPKRAPGDPETAPKEPEEVPEVAKRCPRGWFGRPLGYIRTGLGPPKPEFYRGKTTGYEDVRFWAQNSTSSSPSKILWVPPLKTTPLSRESPKIIRRIFFKINDFVKTT